MKHKTVKKSSNYKIDGGKLIRGRKFCPKCGPGVFLAVHKGRLHCGRCGYSEFEKKTKVAQIEAPKSVQEKNA